MSTSRGEVHTLFINNGTELMKFISALLLLTLTTSVLANKSNQLGERNSQQISINQKLKTAISQKSIQNVLRTVELLKEQKESNYREKKNKVSKN